MEQVLRNEDIKPFLDMNTRLEICIPKQLATIETTKEKIFRNTCAECSHYQQIL